MHDFSGMVSCSEFPGADFPGVEIAEVEFS